MTANDAEDQQLRHWAQRVQQALQLLDIEVEPARIVQVAERSDAAAGERAGLVSAFLAGYAAGTADTGGREDVRAAMDASLNTVNRLCDDGAAPDPDREGWTATGQ